MTEQFRQARLSRDPRFDGRFFVAVRTTGIFCRPICPAKPPHEANVEYYELAHQAMQAGFRPCLRCRPDSAPGSAAWRGVDTTVDRGLRLLNDFPALSVTQIADKLGITDRYFRALLQRHVGVSPKQYRLFEQLLFAKQLLHQGQLNVEEVAHASGFSSSRRLQTHMKAITGLTPTQIRQQRQVQTDDLIELQLPFRPPFAWRELRDFLKRRAIQGIETVTDDSYGRNFTLNNAHGYFEACYREQQHCFDVKINIDDIHMLKATIGQIRRILDLQCDPQVIAEALIKAGIPQHAYCHGLRLPGIWHPFEAGCRAILGQQVSVGAAVKLVTAMVQAIDHRIEGRLQFPSPAQVAEHSLSCLKMPASRRDTLRRFAEYMAKSSEQSASKECLPQECLPQHGLPQQGLPQECLPQDWLDIKGIGPWTVGYVKLRGYSEPDLWLCSDLVVKKQLAQIPIDASKAAPWRSYLTFQLWNMA